MITEKEYQQALTTIAMYEDQCKKCAILMDHAVSNFPIGCLVQSKKSKHVRGVVIGHGIRECSPLLKLRCDNGKKTTCLITNATKL